MTHKQISYLIERLHKLAAMVDCKFVPDNAKIKQLLDHEKDTFPND